MRSVTAAILLFSESWAVALGAVQSSITLALEAPQTGWHNGRVTSIPAAENGGTEHLAAVGTLTRLDG